MSASLQVSTSTPNFQLILNKARSEYKKKTKRDLITDPLAEEIRGCDSPEAILAVLRKKAVELNQSPSSDERLTKWLTPTVNVLNALSATVGQGVGIVFPPTQIIFSGLNIFLVVNMIAYHVYAARDMAASRDTLIELFDKIENFFVRLQTYTEVPPTPAMTDVMGNIMAEVVSMLAIATKMMKQRRTKTFLQKLIGRNDIEDAMQRLDKLERVELRTVTARVLKTTCDLKDIASGLKGAASDLKDDAKETKVIVQQIANDMNTRDCSYCHVVIMNT
ncbi:hypothetical protein EI94DRAFT_1703026 [Lactarius quietus]|nr:hypothetical protein EI94DRAFT_1703026 [Lactarius quietus]